MRSYKNDDGMSNNAHAFKAEVRQWSDTAHLLHYLPGWLLRLEDELFETVSYIYSKNLSSRFMQATHLNLTPEQFNDIHLQYLNFAEGSPIPGPEDKADKLIELLSATHALDRELKKSFLP